MKRFNKQVDNQPMIVRFSTSMNNGIESRSISRHAIGYILRGNKYIYDGDTCIHAQQGDIFFMGQGTHHVENVSDKGSHFEQIVFYLSSEELKEIITSFLLSYNLTITNDHSCKNCRSGNSLVAHDASYLKSFFNSAVEYLYDDNFSHDQIAENIKTAELIYHIITHADNCLKSKIIGCIDLNKSSFEQLVYNNTFKHISIDELAAQSNRSLTAFKKEFQQIFEEAPHRWFIAQRLSHARLLLISTRKSVAEIGNECIFANTSHFIKLFKRAYHQTPAAYRSKHIQLTQHSNVAISAPKHKFEKGANKVV